MEEYFVEKKTSYDRLLDVLVFLAVLVVTVFLILDILASAGKIALSQAKLAQIYYPIDIVVFIIFVLDLVRLWKEAANYKEFLIKNWLDILATIPFGLLLQVNSPLTQIVKWGRVAKMGSGAAKIAKASRVSKIGKEFKAAAHLKSESEEYQRKHRL
jgi:hypothetical protein